MIGPESSITDLWYGFYEKWSPVRRERRFEKGTRQTFPIQRSSYHRASFIREISTWVWKEIRNCLHLGLIYCALSFVQKIRTTSSTDHIQNYNQRRDGHSRLLFLFEPSLAPCDYLSFVFTTPSRKAVWENFWNRVPTLFIHISESKRVTKFMPE